ncbi:membrane-associated protein, putative [Bodo saltans]|uniref:Membrane-associated protein, putative n=1 Tax=Bodo saltans TaxID=75058 RepID=A0A0S4IWT1_BODSA|nr:membrane-associated protein, putative [Bodo saltans]|eukprot:CUG32360.1 membrane-associated protein, putative [Bodo saltans]
MVLVCNGAVIVAAAVIVLACAVMPAASTIIVANSIVGRLSEPTQTCTVAFPTVEGAPLAVLDSQLEGQQLTIVTELLVIQVEEFSASRKLTTGGRRSGKRGVISVLDSTTDEPLAAFEYAIDRDEALGSVAEGNALVYTSSPPTPGASKSKANPVIGSVQFTVEGSSSDTMTYTMKFAMEEDHHSGVFPIDAVLVMTSTDAGQRVRLEDDAKAASSIFGRWVSPMVLFGGLYGLLYAFSWWKAKVSVAAASATSSGDAAGAKKAKKE